jgi:predicted MFS family arabinose efflux permease
MNQTPRARLLGPVLVMTTMVAAIVSSLGAPLIPTIADDLQVSLSSAQWSLTITLLTGAVSAPVMGRLGDGPRRRATMIGALAVVTAGAVIAALAPGFGGLMVGRALQGVGLGLVPLAMAAARDSLPDERVAPMIGLLSVSAAAGIGAGYPVSGALADAAGLSGAFWVGAAVCALALVCVAVVVPSTADGGPAAAPLDWTGAVLLSAALITLLVAVSEGGDWGWGSPEIVVLLLTGGALASVWAVQQLRASAPLVQLRLLRRPAVLAGDVCALVLAVAMYMNLSAVTQIVQLPRSTGYGFGTSALMGGLILVPLSVLMLGGSYVLPMLVRHAGIRVVLAVGCLVVGAASALFALWHGALWQAFAMMAVLGIGVGTTFAAIPGLIVRSVPAQETGSAMGFYQVVRYVGFSSGSAVAASILASHTPDPTGAPTLSGYTTVLWAASAICVLAAILAWVLPARGQEVPPEQRLDEDETILAERTEGDDLAVGNARPRRANDGNPRPTENRRRAQLRSP